MKSPSLILVICSLVFSPVLSAQTIIDPDYGTAKIKNTQGAGDGKQVKLVINEIEATIQPGEEVWIPAGEFRYGDLHQVSFDATGHSAHSTGYIEFTSSWNNSIPTITVVRKYLSQGLFDVYFFDKGANVGMVVKFENSSPATNNFKITLQGPEEASWVYYKPTQAEVDGASRVRGTFEIITGSADYGDTGYSEDRGVYVNEDLHVSGNTFLDGSLSIGGNPVLTSTPSGLLDLNSGAITGNGNFGLSFGNTFPASSDGALTISHTGRTIGVYEYDNVNLNNAYISLDDGADQRLAFDSNQISSSDILYLQSDKHFDFQVKDRVSTREIIANFSVNPERASMQIANTTTTTGEFYPVLLGVKHNTGAQLTNPALHLQGVIDSELDQNNASDSPVIHLVAKKITDGNPLSNGVSVANRDIFSIKNKESAVSAIRVAADGKVGLGTNDPEANLHVVSDAKIEGTTTISGTTILEGDVIISQPQGDILMGIYGVQQ